MKSLVLYRIFSYFLIAIAALLGIISLLGLLVGLSNPEILLDVFVMAAVVVYSFSSFFFLLNGIDGKQQLKSKAKDIINVNAYVALVFVMMIIFRVILIVNNPSILDDKVKEMISMQGARSPVTADILGRFMQAVLWSFLFYAVILGAHISMTFRLLKQYAHLFGEKKSDDIHPERID
ncbi:MAG: hypothetical protein ABL872_06890 [Lacibacter sp.]